MSRLYRLRAKSGLGLLRGLQVLINALTVHLDLHQKALLRTTYRDLASGLPRFRVIFLCYIVRMETRRHSKKVLPNLLRALGLFAVFEAIFFLIVALVFRVALSNMLSPYFLFFLPALFSLSVHS